ncbi:metallophosphoesterase [Falsibacillus pallidus]|uniref:Phosphoesterase n=1 Tax=Falsibacillus pallidus TaxID=493781 RepID=A0A370GK91_9BACI|nr:metallophosphoesterase [Falsibacillus pallidus]RDI44188.1 hypothetical protein DFR59_103256 [Falsibacillus pallidus]
MKLLVVSDSHGSSGILKELAEKYSGVVDAMIHCGDSELKADDEAIVPFITVRGNCDMDARFPECQVKTIVGSKVFVTHGHLFGIKMSLDKLFYRAKEEGADFVFFGHSHLVGAERIEDIIFLNPGSILLPRGRVERTYAIVEKLPQKVVVKIYDDAHSELDDLRTEFSF